MKVKLLAYTPQPEKLCGVAARSCVSRKPPSELTDLPEEKLNETLNKALSKGHQSVIEHASFTFSLEGISRACSHQLVRHRIASYSQQSQRYVQLSNLDYATPPSILKSGEALKVFKKALKAINEAYNALIKMNIPLEDARYILPNAALTNIVVTMNARELFHFFELRCCLHAQWEIREAAWEMLKKAREAAPKLFEKAGPSCIFKGICPENDFSCPFYKKFIIKQARQ
ncbi:FAD-dependent thymidylate synthase [Candidatus Bathyarchaeota archaeon]|nr:FAD-dependent thymidylate synthase [Candidatus Bathyarchaeota archaeon]